MQLPNRWYDLLKWIDLVCLPALTVFYVTCSAVWGWPYANEIAKTSAAVCTLIGALLGISTAEYNKGKHED